MPDRFVELLCLANSRKQGGRCIAGLDVASGTWVRPVAATEHGELSLDACTLDSGKLPQLLDVFRVPLDSPAAEPHQPENWLITPGKRWQDRGALSLPAARPLLNAATSTGPDIFGDKSDRVDWDAIQAQPLPESLTLVNVASPTFEFNAWTSFRARFLLQNTYYDLGFTDLSARAITIRGNAPVQTTTDWYLTISLGEPYWRDSKCYKLAAAAIEDV